MVILFAATLLPAAAATPRSSHSSAPARTTVATFRLQVQGGSAGGTTYWVAYGPLAGRWGLIRLHRSGSGLYTARKALPADGRTVFTYLAGQGTVMTKLGPAPGWPVQTIRSVGPTTAPNLPSGTVRWQAPIG
jgi:hypothetical protein